MKTYHGKTNYNRLVKFTMQPNDRECFMLGSDHCVFEWLPCKGSTQSKYRLTYKNDEITFVINHADKTVTPTHVTNIIDDIDQDTFVTGSTRIIKPHVMRMADERLYKVAEHIKDFHRRW